MRTELSAGGVVVRQAEGRTEVAAVSPRARVLALPKGHPEPGESLERAAAREVREETGLTADLERRLGEIGYWYVLQGERIKKTVVFFLFRYRSGSTDDHDYEVLSAEWIDLEESVEALSYQGEREMAAKALETLSAE